jgi:hypothetical protein
MAPARGVALRWLSCGRHVARGDGAEVAGEVSRLDRYSLRAENPSLIGTAMHGAVRMAVWSRRATPRDQIVLLFCCSKNFLFNIRCVQISTRMNHIFLRCSLKRLLRIHCND